MAIGSGLGASFGVAPETWGTYAAPTRFLAGESHRIDKVQTVQPVSGVAAGRMAPPDEVVTTEGATGAWSGNVMRVGFGMILQHLFGGSAVPVQQAATTAYLQTHTWTDNIGKGLTAQIGRPNTAGTVTPLTGIGGKITSAQISCGVGEKLMLAMDLDFKQYTEAQTLAAPSYTAGNLPFHFKEMTVKLGTYASEASVTGVRKVDVTLARPMDTEAYYAGAAGLKAQQIYNDFSPFSGSLDVDMVTAADFVDRWTGHTSTSMVLEWVGPIIASTYAYTFRLKFPKVYFGGGLGEISGPDIVKGSIPFTAFQDSTNGLCIAEYMSTDTAV